MSESQYWIFINIKNQMRSRKISQLKAENLIQKLSDSDVNDWFAWTSIFRDWIPLKNIVKKNGDNYLLMIILQGEFFEESNDVDESTMITSGEHTHIPEKYTALESLIEKVPLQEGDFMGDQLTMSDIPVPPSLHTLFEKEFADGNIIRSRFRKGGSVKSETEVASERRLATRFNIKVDVLILAKGLSFRSETANLSVSGALLVKPLPEIMAETPLEVVFIFKKAKINENFAVKGKVLSNRENLRHLSFGNLSNESKKEFERLIKIYFQEITP
jgi:hypothetical protein